MSKFSFAARYGVSPRRLWRGDGIDVINDQVQIPLRQIFEAGAFGKDFAQFCVGIFNAAFLTAAHGIAVINAGTLVIIHTSLQGLRIAEFATPVSQDCFKKDAESHGAKPFFQAVKDSPDSALGTAVQKIGKEQLFIPEIKSQDTFFRIP